MIIIPFIAFLAAIIVYLLYKNYKLEYKRSAIRNKHMDEALELHQLAQKTGPEVVNLYENLSDQEKTILFEKAIVFIYEKQWSADFSQEDKVSEAIKACLPLIHRDTNFYPGLEHIQAPRTFKDWLEFHEKQFEVEKGKMALKELKGHFPTLAEAYFTSPQNLAQKQYDMLQSYFNPLAVQYS